ncbi:hypothetical protein MNBD_GAMMA19-2072, partial [hydrothermal vent metagenome]
FAISAAVFIRCISFVIFGQITIRKLRKNLETKHNLGIEFASGWDILNVTGALALPKVVAHKIQRNSMVFETDPDALYQYTAVFDRVLARAFYIPFSFSGFGLSYYQPCIGLAFLTEIIDEN